ncbi:DUF3606 domain-containing protein [Ramlibacter sp. PS4R-6]|uniref:DUF3606 domain-containing protein n=1 Tax=Ramlibacter sp. PS4R-6 TaxID=3133438 RepID=UPI0030B0C49A
MSVHKTGTAIGENDRIHLDDEWEVCAWARYFNASERRVKEAVAAVGDSAMKVREHLRGHSEERPSA